MPSLGLNELKTEIYDFVGQPHGVPTYILKVIEKHRYAFQSAIVNRMCMCI